MSHGTRYGYLPPYSEDQRRADMERVQREDEERARNTRAWNRLCGMLSPIGGPAER